MVDAIRAYKSASSLSEALERIAVIPEFGDKNSFYIARILKGSKATFISGRAELQYSEILQKVLHGGGFQVRFRDFDLNWIIDVTENKGEK